MLESTALQSSEPSDFISSHLAQSELRRSRIQQLEDDITELAAHIDAATFRWLELIREFDACKGWEGDGLRSCPHWLNWKCGLGLNSARERLRVAHALAELPQTRAAFREGRLSYSKARAITRVATPKNEDVLLNIALNGTASHVERAVKVWRREKRLQVLEQENHRHDVRELIWYTDDDGCFVLHGRFTREQGAVIRQALEAVMEEMHEERKDVSAETSAMELPSAVKFQPQPRASIRADALARIAEGWLAGTSECSSGDRFVTNLHTDLGTLRLDGTGAESELEGAENVSAETSRRIACDAGVVHWLEQRNGPEGIEPLSVGRKTRTVPPAIRRALQRRDQGCQFPGCTCSRFVDAHHIHHWADGGETSMHNLVLLCRHHHRLVHEGGFGLSKTASEGFRFTDPAGKVIPAAPERRFRGNVFELVASNHLSDITITPKTPIPGWLGERMDVGTVIEGLLMRE